MRLLTAALTAAYLLVAVAIVHADVTPPSPPPDVVHVVSVKPRAHAADYLYMSFDGCKNALLGVNPDNTDNDIIKVRDTPPIKSQLGWGASPTRMLDGTIRAFYRYYYYGTSHTWEFRCRRLSSTNVDDWPIWQ